MSSAVTQLSSMRGREHALSDDDKRYIENLYTELLQKSFARRSGCSDCYRDAIIELLIKIKHSGMKPREYELKNGVVLFDHETQAYYTNANITDKFAAKYLKGNPDAIGLFSRVADAAPDGTESIESEPTDAAPDGTGKPKSKRGRK